MKGMFGVIFQYLENNSSYRKKETAENFLKKIDSEVWVLEYILVEETQLVIELLYHGKHTKVMKLALLVRILKIQIIIEMCTIHPTVNAINEVI